MNSFFKGKPYSPNRLFCLDALRGLDMFLLTVVGPLFWAFHKVFVFSDPVVKQFRHGWEGFTLWDIIMPLFIFMCGAAMPFALEKRLKEGPASFWKHVGFRVAMLWVLGGCSQGNWAAFDMTKFCPFANTLQSIAIGYLVTAVVMATRVKALLVVVPAALALGYAALLHFCGGYAEFGNLAFKVDQKIFSWIMPPDNSYIAKPNHYTWFLTSMMFAAMTLSGFLATKILTSAAEKKVRAKRLFAYGAGLLAFGWAVSPVIPVIKPIFTLSFTAQAMGWSVLALAVLFVLTDILMWRRGWGLILLYGQFALTAYLFRGFFGRVTNGFTDALTQGFPHLFGKNAAVILTAVASAGALTFILLVRRAIKSRD